MARPAVDPKVRFSKMFKVVESGCHEWTSTIHRDGYGKFYFRAKQMQAHRVAFILTFGEIPTGLHVLHKCDNRKCVNPEHLYAGTPKQNVEDKFARCGWYGRMKYTQAQIDHCKCLRGEGKTQQEIADITGIPQTTVSNFLRKKIRNWRI